MKYRAGWLAWLVLAGLAAPAGAQQRECVLAKLDDFTALQEEWQPKLMDALGKTDPRYRDVVDRVLADQKLRAEMLRIAVDHYTRLEPDRIDPSASPDEWLALGEDEEKALADLYDRYRELTEERAALAQSGTLPTEGQLKSLLHKELGKSGRFRRMLRDFKRARDAVVEKSC